MIYYINKETHNNKPITLALAVKGNQMKSINYKSGVISKKQKYAAFILSNYKEIKRDEFIKLGIDVQSLIRYW